MAPGRASSALAGALQRAVSKSIDTSMRRSVSTRSISGGARPGRAARRFLRQIPALGLRRIAPKGFSLKSGAGRVPRLVSPGGRVYRTERPGGRALGDRKRGANIPVCHSERPILQTAARFRRASTMADRKSAARGVFTGGFVFRRRRWRPRRSSWSARPVDRQIRHWRPRRRAGRKSVSKCRILAG